MTRKPPLVFDRVEALRKHMLLTASQMAKVLSTSRGTYGSWVTGTKLRPTNEARVRDALRKMLKVMAVHDWPQPEVIAMPPADRLKILLELIAQVG